MSKETTTDEYKQRAVATAAPVTRSGLGIKLSFARDFVVRDASDEVSVTRDE